MLLTALQAFKKTREKWTKDQDWSYVGEMWPGAHTHRAAGPRPVPAESVDFSKESVGFLEGPFFRITQAFFQTLLAFFGVLVVSSFWFVSLCWEVLVYLAVPANRSFLSK